MKLPFSPPLLLRLPSTYPNPSSPDTLSITTFSWKEYFRDSTLKALIDSALQHNQELHIIEAEIEIARSEVKARTGEYLPFLHVGGSAEWDKVGAYTRTGAVERSLQIVPGRSFPVPFPTYEGGGYARWEIDIWKRLRNARKAAFFRYLASVEAKRLATTHLVAEVAEAYYELLALDNLLTLLETYVQIQQNALQLVRLNKQAGRATQLAVNRFEARLLNTQNRRYTIQQRRIEVENRLTFLLGYLPPPLPYPSQPFLPLVIDTSKMIGVPFQLLYYRPDLRQAYQEMQAAHVEVEVARTAFYPTLTLQGALGMQAFQPTFLLSPESMIYRLVLDALMPLINRNALYAAYASATARQKQAILRYNQTLLQAYTEVVTQIGRLRNLSQSLYTKSEEVRILTESIPIANYLYRAGEADYLEVLLTQSEALDAQMELIEIQMEFLRAQIQLYRALGGGWQ
jgi:NodT family efflux transporter outer membrane factor (OMF) lipoprotein